MAVAAALRPCVDAKSVCLYKLALTGLLKPNGIYQSQHGIEIRVAAHRIGRAFQERLDRLSRVLGRGTVGEVARRCQQKIQSAHASALASRDGCFQLTLHGFEEGINLLRGFRGRRLQGCS